MESVVNWYDKYQRMKFAERTADCWGFVRHVYRDELGIDLPSYLSLYDNSEDPKIGGVIEEQRKSWREVERPELFDIVLMRLSSSGAACHVGIALGNGNMIHMRRKTGVVIQPLNGLEWKRRIYGFIRHASR